MRLSDWSLVAICGIAMTSMGVGFADAQPMGKWRSEAAIQQVNEYVQQHCTIEFDEGDIRALRPLPASIDDDGKTDYYADVPTDLVAAKQCSPQSIRFVWMSSEGYAFTPPGPPTTAIMGDAPASAAVALNMRDEAQASDFPPTPPVPQTIDPSVRDREPAGLEAAADSASQPVRTGSLVPIIAFVVASVGSFIPISVISWKLGTWFRNMTIPDYVHTRNIMHTFYSRIFWICGPQVIALCGGAFVSYIIGGLAAAVVAG